jgi:hypothetical protein
MPKYDFAHPKFNRGFVTFPVKEDTLFEKFCKIAQRNRVNVIKSQMVITTKDYTAKVFNRFSYIEIRKDGKSQMLHNEQEIRNYIEGIVN